MFIKALNKSHCRDYSAMEVCHHVLKLPAHHCSASFQVAGFRRQLDPETGAFKRSAYDKYLARGELVPEALKNEVAPASLGSSSA